MEYFILNCTWNILYFIFRILGIYPFEKYGETRIKPKPTYCIWLRLLCTFSLPIVFHISIGCNLIFVESIPPEEIFNTINQDILSSGVSRFVLFIHIMNIYLFGFICVFKLRQRCHSYLQ